MAGPNPLVYILGQIIRDLRTTNAVEEEWMQQLEAENFRAAQDMRSAQRLLARCAVAFPALDVIVTLATPWCIYLLGDYNSIRPPMLAMGFGLALLLITITICLGAGVGLGCLLAPPTMFDSPFGTRILKIIGTKNRTAAWLCCWFFVILGVSIIVGIGVLQYGSMQHTRNQPPW